MTSDGCPIALPLPAQRLVALLALADRPLQRVYVAGKLWLDSTEEHANASLRTALWRLRACGAAVVHTSGTRIALADEVDVDVRELAATAERVLAGAAAATREAIAVLCAGGELLPDWYDDWVVVDRERVRQLRLHALETLCAQLRADECYADAIAAGFAAVGCEPLRETAHRALIETFIAEGNAFDALRQYRLFRDLIARELGLEPSPLLMRFMEPLLNE